jgi:regulator of protease activity HflC (stomatin/prohibitin superfamily)
MIIQDNERGLLFRNGNYIKVMNPGKHFVLGLFGYSVQVMNLERAFIADRNLNIFLKDASLKAMLSIVEVKDYEICLHYEDGILSETLKAGKFAYWNILKNHEFKIIDTRNPIPAEDFDISIFSNPKLLGLYYNHIIENHEVGILFFNGIFQKNLQPGKYFYWIGNITIAITKFDLRQQQLDMTGQELMTEDKITLRLNFMCHYKIVDPVKIAQIKNYEEQIYILLQLFLREYIGSLKLDELLQKKQEIGEFILNKLQEKSEQLGLQFIFAGLKDIILPGEIKDILNLVLVAEKKAQANIITRREETASTRSLLNTAKLMEENPTLYRLKELEYIEKISEKISNINLSSNNGLLEQLSGILNVNKK